MKAKLLKIAVGLVLAFTWGPAFSQSTCDPLLENGSHVYFGSGDIGVASWQPTVQNFAINTKTNSVRIYGPQLGDVGEYLADREVIYPIAEPGLKVVNYHIVRPTPYYDTRIHIIQFSFVEDEDGRLRFRYTKRIKVRADLWSGEQTPEKNAEFLRGKKNILRGKVSLSPYSGRTPSLFELNTETGILKIGANEKDLAASHFPTNREDFVSLHGEDLVMFSAFRILPYYDTDSLVMKVLLRKDANGDLSFLSTSTIHTDMGASNAVYEKQDLRRIAPGVFSGTMGSRGLRYGPFSFEINTKTQILKLGHGIGEFRLNKEISDINNDPDKDPSKRRVVFSTVRLSPYYGTELVTLKFIFDEDPNGNLEFRGTGFTGIHLDLW